jgi:pyruvate/2-oxoglutarate dehydrogenase complex dihydrolipoamide dehydrogenase (E3) component
MGDTFDLNRSLDRNPSTALIVGAGYIGLEMADALRTRGLDVIIVEQLPQVLSTVDADLAELIAEDLDRHSVKLTTSTAVSAIAHERHRHPPGIPQNPGPTKSSAPPT